GRRITMRRRTRPEPGNWRRCHNRARTALEPNRGNMTAAPARPVQDSLIDLFQHLGFDRVHIASGQLVPSDWLGLVAQHPERVASLTLMSPRPRPQLHALAARLLVVPGD